MTSNATGSPLPHGFRLPPIGPGHPEYDTARRVWNGFHDPFPAWILRCSSTAEIAAAAHFASEHGTPLAVRGGGHSFPGYGSCIGGVVIDLSPMAGVEIDSRGIASVGGGATWGALDGATAPRELAVPGGLVSTTGVAGLTLGGGIGWLSRPYGLSCDSLVAAEVVLADGTVTRASEEDAPELLWALRGGGGNFGVISRFDFRLQALPANAEVLGGMVLYPADAAEVVLRDYESRAASMPDQLSTLIAFVSVPPLPFLPESIHFAPAVAIALCDIGDPAAAEARSLPLRRLATPLADLVSRTPYVAQQQLFDAAAPAGLRQYAVGANLDRLSAAAVATLAEQAALRPTPLCQIHVHQLGGAVARVAEDATAYAGRSTGWIVNIIATWIEPRQDDVARDWARETRRRLDTLASARTYLNFLGDSGVDEVRNAYGETKHERLRRLKRRYDPSNLFRINANILPAD